MTALIIIGVILLLIILALIRFGVGLTYGDKKILVKASAGPVRVTLYPRPKKPQEEERRRKEEKQARRERKRRREREEPTPEKEGKKPELLKDIILPVLETLGRLRRKLTINTLTVHITSGGPDPCDTALSFGRTSAVLGALMPLIENTFRVKERDIRTDVSFDAAETEIFVDARLTLAFWEIIYIALALAPLLRAAGGGETGKVDKHGQASDK